MNCQDSIRKLLGSSWGSHAAGGIRKSMIARDVDFLPKASGFRTLEIIFEWI